MGDTFPSEVTDEQVFHSVCQAIMQRPAIAIQVVRWLIPDYCFGPSTSLTERPVRYTGTIKSFVQKTNFGFVTSPAIQQQFGTDVWIHRAQLSVFKVGDLVNFAVLLNKEGKPQAFDLCNPDEFKEQESTPIMPLAAAEAALLGMASGQIITGLPSPAGTTSSIGAAPATDGQQPAAGPYVDVSQIDTGALTSRRYKGSMKSFDQAKGYGFITCPELYQLFQKDVYVHFRQCEGFTAGCEVTFSITMGKSGMGPQALNLQAHEPLAQGSGFLGGQCLGTDAQGKKRYVGVIKSFNTQSGFGFIACPEIHAEHDRDVFVYHRNFQQGMDVSVGNVVTFTKLINKDNHPQAIEVRPHEDPNAMASAVPSPYQPGMADFGMESAQAAQSSQKHEPQIMAPGPRKIPRRV